VRHVLWQSLGPSGCSWSCRSRETLVEVVGKWVLVNKCLAEETIRPLHSNLDSGVRSCSWKMWSHMELKIAPPSRGILAHQFACEATQIRGVSSDRLTGCVFALYVHGISRAKHLCSQINRTVHRVSFAFFCPAQAYSLLLNAPKAASLHWLRRIIRPIIPHPRPWRIHRLHAHPQAIQLLVPHHHPRRQLT